jgi:hypothetical protein
MYDASPCAIMCQALLVTPVYQAQEMGARSYYQHLLFINTQEIPWIPPFEHEQAFNDNIIKEILLFATPPEWQREID